MSRRAGVIALGLLVALVALTPTAEAAVFRSIAKILGGVFQVPAAILTGTFTGPPVVGTAFGAVNGVIGGVGMVASGLLDLASSAFGIAKAVGPYVLPFVF